MSHQCNSTTLRSAAKIRNFGSLCLNLIRHLHKSVPSRCPDGPLVIVKIFDNSCQSAFVDLDEVSEPDLYTKEMARTKVHDTLANDGVGLFVCRGWDGCRDAMFMEIDAEYHSDDIKLLP